MTTPGKIDLNSLLLFDKVAESGSFTGAAERLGIAKAKVSIGISRLEAQLGTTLFSRTTRQVSLTESGRSFHAQCQPLLRGIEDAVDRIGMEQTELSGTLRISTTVDHAIQALAPAAAKFAALHPRLQIDLRTADRVIDMVGEGIDLAIRLGWLRDSSMRAVKLGEFDQYVVAAPGYLQRSGRIRHPSDLASQEWLTLTLLPTPLTWTFQSRSGESHTVHMKSRLRVDSTGALRAMLYEGAGMSIVGQYNLAEDLKSGRLVRLLPHWSLPRGGIHAVYPPGRHISAKARAFIEFYRGQLG